MLFAANGLIGCPVKASDGEAGTVDDFLFDDRTWLIRWLSLDAGAWLEGRKVLVPPSAIAPIVIPPKPAFPMLSFGETLTLNLAVTRAEIESGAVAQGDDEPVGRLGGVSTVVGFRVHAEDGEIGPVETVLADDANWSVRYFVVATHAWLPGKQVQLARCAVSSVDWGDRRVRVNVTREEVRSAPAWDPLAMVDEIQLAQLHRHFGWPS
jgi:hypothetical protein